MTHTTESLMALADAYAYHKALINVSNMLHSQILETDESREALRAALTEALDMLDFYKRRVELLQKWQSKMRDPERTMACDIIANGQMMPEGERYEIQAAQPVREPLSLNVVRALWHQTLDATKGPLPIEEFATVLAKHYGIGGVE